MKKKWTLVLLFVSIIFFGYNTNTLAVPYFDNVSFYTENNPTFGGTGWIYQFGATVYDDDYAIQSVIARDVNTDDEYILSDLVTLTGTFHWGGAEITGAPWLDQLEIIATNTNGEEASVFTHVLDNERQLDFATNVTISDNSLMPTFDWSPVEHADTYRVRILDSGGDRIFDSILVGDNFTETFYTMPEGFLEYGESYTLRLIADEWDFENDVWQLENRSSTYVDFQTAPVPEPATMLLLGAGLVGLVAAKRKLSR